MIKTFCETFKRKAPRNRPGLILKTSHAHFSIIDRDVILDKIQTIIAPYGNDIPNIYLIHGDFTDNEFYNLAIERIIFDVIWQFDDHTWPQFYFFDECLSQVKNKTYFLLDSNFNNNFKKYLNLEDPIDCPRNATTNNTLIIANKIKDELFKNNDLVSKIKEAYEQDYDLINSVKFIDYSK